MLNYIGTYRVFQQLNLSTQKPSSNDNDTYLKCKNNLQIYRHDKDNLAIYLPTTNIQNKYLPELNKLIKLDLLSEGDFEATYLFKESDLEKITYLIKPQIQGKNIHPKSVKTAKKQLKYNNK